MFGVDKWRQRTAASYEKCGWVPCTIRIRLWTLAEKERCVLKLRSKHTDSYWIRAADIGPRELTNVFASTNVLMV